MILKRKSLLLYQIISLITLMFLFSVGLGASRELFDPQKIDINATSLQLYSLLFSSCLISFPFFMGKNISHLIDSEKEDKKNRLNYVLGIIVGFLGTFTTNFLYIFMYLSRVQKNGGRLSYLQGEYFRYNVDMFLTIVPFMILLTTFCISLLMYNKHSIRLKGVEGD